MVADLSLSAQAKAALLANVMTRSGRIHASCTGATILLSGSARTDEERKVAQQTVAQIPGVADVENNIIVVPVSRRVVGV